MTCEAGAICVAQPAARPQTQSSGAARCSGVERRSATMSEDAADSAASISGCPESRGRCRNARTRRRGGHGKHNSKPAWHDAPPHRCIRVIARIRRRDFGLTESAVTECVGARWWRAPSGPRTANSIVRNTRRFPRLGVLLKDRYQFGRRPQALGPTHAITSSRPGAYKVQCRDIASGLRSSGAIGHSRDDLILRGATDRVGTR